jgi:hypothetical protein
MIDVAECSVERGEQEPVWCLGYRASNRGRLAAARQIDNGVVLYRTTSRLRYVSSDPLLKRQMIMYQYLPLVDVYEMTVCVGESKMNV